MKKIVASRWWNWFMFVFCLTFGIFDMLGDSWWIRGLGGLMFVFAGWSLCCATLVRDWEALSDTWKDAYLQQARERQITWMLKQKRDI